MRNLQEHSQFKPLNIGLNNANKIDFYNLNNNNMNLIEEQDKEKRILNSMKESLDTFLLNLKTKTSSDNITKQDIQNYYLTDNELLNSLNFDLLSSYQTLIQQNINQNNYKNKKKFIKRAFSTKEVINRPNKSNVSYSNFNNKHNKRANNRINSYLDKNSSQVTQTNSFFYNDNETINKSLSIKNLNNKNSNESRDKQIYNNNNNKKYYPQKKFEYPIKLINNNNLNEFNSSFLYKNSLQNNNLFSKSTKNNSKLYTNYSNLEQNILLSKENNNKNKALILSNIYSQFQRLKKENKKNKLEIKDFYNYYSQLMKNIFFKIKIHLYKCENIYNEKIENFQKEIRSLKNINESYKKENEYLREMSKNYNINKDNNNDNIYENNQLLEEKNNTIFLLQEELNTKNDKIDKLLKEQSENKKTIEGFKKIMKDVKITLENYEVLQKKQIEYEKIMKKSNLSNEELNNKIKELNEKNYKLKLQIDLFKNEKRNISIENEKNKNFVNSYKTSYDLIIKEKDELKKEKLKLMNEIEIIKKNNKKMNNIKINNNIKIQNNTKLRETINELNKEKNMLELKYKNLQKTLDEQAMKNRSMSASILKTSTFIKHKKFYNLSKIKIKSFTIYNINKANEQKQRMNPNKKKKKFNKLIISNKITILYKSDNINNLSKSKLSKSKNNQIKKSIQNEESYNNINIKKINNESKSTSIQNNKKEKKYINEIYNCELFTIFGSIKIKEEINVEEYINKINELNNQISEKNEYINLLEEEKNNQNKNQVISDTGNFQINKLKDLNKLLQDKCNRLKEENTRLKNLEKNYLNTNTNTNSNEFSINDYNKLKQENDEKENKIENLNLTIDGLNEELKEIKLKLMQYNTNSEKINKDNTINENSEENNTKIQELNKTIEQLQKEKNDINISKIKEISQLRVDISKLKIQIYSLTNELETYKEKKEKDNNDNINTINDNNIEDERNKKLIEELKNKNNLLINKLKDAQEKITKANKVLKKAKNNSLYYKYVSQLIKEVKPSGDKEINLFLELKKIIELEDKEKKEGEKNLE